MLLTMHSLSASECSHFEALKGQSVQDVDSLCTGACGGYLVTGDTPVLFFSPGWPGQYGNHADCVWIIYAPDSTVELNILSMDIESQSTCAYDKLIIKDGKKLCREHC